MNDRKEIEDLYLIDIFPHLKKVLLALSKALEVICHVVWQGIIIIYSILIVVVGTKAIWWSVFTWKP